MGKNLLNDKIKNIVKTKEKQEKITRTQNGAFAYSTTFNAVYDLFALGGSYRVRSESDCIDLFKKAFFQNKLLALKCLFYLGDCRGGQGERRFFRICFSWLANNYPEIAKPLISLIPEYRRWDDLIYCCLDTPVEDEMISEIKYQLLSDLKSEHPSLLAKWMPSENASSKETIAAATQLRKALNLSSKDYRGILSTLREEIKVLESLMSKNEWDKIEFNKVPSGAGLRYYNTFMSRSETAERYKDFIKNKNTKVKTRVLYPHELVRKAIGNSTNVKNSKEEQEVLQKYWDNYLEFANFGDKKLNALCVVDTSASMSYFNPGSSVRPIDVAIALGLYAAQNIEGTFKNSYITFSSYPKLVEVNPEEGFVNSVKKIYENMIVENTSLKKVFDLLFEIIKKNHLTEEEIPENIIIISDMEIDALSDEDAENSMNQIRQKWEESNIKMPKLTYWNVNAENDIFLEDSTNNINYVSGFSPILFQSIVSNETGYDLCLKFLYSSRYNQINIESK